MWSGRAENTFILLPQVLYFNLEKRICQVGSQIKISTQNLIRSKQRKGGSSRIALNFCVLQICKIIFVKHLTNL
jgi:hypothetical protein